jgi:hypothetical protein
MQRHGAAVADEFEDRLTALGGEHDMSSFEVRPAIWIGQDGGAPIVSGRRLFRSATMRRLRSNF